MRNSIFNILFLLTVTITTSANAQVTILGSDLTNPPATSCTNTFYTVLGTLANSNYGYSGAIVTVVGFNITVDMPYFSGFAPMPGLTPFTEDVDLGALLVGTYTVTSNGLVDGILSSTDVGTFDVIACCTVVADFTMSSTTTCYPDVVAMTNTSVGATTYSWYNNGFFLTNDPNPGILPSIAGIHTIKLVAEDGICSDSVEYLLEVFVPDAINLGNDTTICVGDSTIFDVTAQSATYEWQDGSTASTYTVDTAGVYWVEVTDSNGCVSMDTIEVFIVICTIGLPEVNTSESLIISPNPAISTIHLEGLSGDYSVSVYSITGELMTRQVNVDSLDVSLFAAGVYIVNVSQEGRTRTQRLIVQH